MSRKNIPDVLVVDAARQCQLTGYDVFVNELLGRVDRRADQGV